MPAAPTGFMLSGSTDGLPIVVAATSTPGTLIHTAYNSVAGFDALWIFASNVTALPATLTLEWGSTTDPGGLLIKGYTIPANSPPVPVAVGAHRLPMQASGVEGHADAQHLAADLPGHALGA